MSTTERRPYAQMLQVATGLVERLRPACHRIEIAGSLRRRKEMIGDIEIVAIPKLSVDLFGDPSGDTEVDLALAHWPITFSKKGRKYKQFSFAGGSGQIYTCDLFLQPNPATWGVNFMLRTGSSDFSHRMVTPRSMGGYMPDRYQVREARVWHSGAMLDTPEEADVFALWEMDFIAPEERR